MPPTPYDPNVPDDSEDVSALGGDVGFLLSLARTHISRRVNEALEPVGLRTRTYSVLTLAAESDALTQRAIADALALNPSQIVAMVDDLTARGLVERRAHAGDRRARTVAATLAGEALQDEARERVESALATALGGLDDKQQQDLRMLLRLLLSTLGNPEPALQ